MEMNSMNRKERKKYIIEYNRLKEQIENKRVDNMKKAEKEYHDNSFLGGITKSGKFRHNILADKLLANNTKKDYFNFNTHRDMNRTIKVKKEPIDRISREHQKRLVPISKEPRDEDELKRIALKRIRSLADKGWIENPKKFSMVDRISKLKDTKRVK
jgi:hypothetical protein